MTLSTTVPAAPLDHGPHDHCCAHDHVGGHATPAMPSASRRQWVKGLAGPMPDGHYDLKSFAVDAERKNVSAYAVFLATHTGEGAPCPTTGKSVATDYVYVMSFDGDKISHMTNIWHSGIALQQLGWV